MTYEASGSIQVLKRTCSMCTNPVHRCFDNPEGLNYGYLPFWHGFHVRELTNDLRLGITVPR
jgi:hypothetical protein